MSINRKKRLWAVLAVAGIGTVFASNSCSSYYTSLALTSFDFCAVLNCTGGTFFNLCEPVAILADCPTPAE